MTRRSVSGPFSAQHLGSGAWQLTTRAANPVQIHLQIAGPAAADALQDPGLQRLDFDWRDSGVAVTLTRAAGTAAFKARTVILHDPKANLYESLPLAGFDADAQRFWKRVFRLMRIPGGRLLLGVMARRNR
ncbi:MAG: hypothetical protein QOD56_2551 [Gammaproteobacteria bacterium]|jgi:hypothetical protein|nr:hypothetical protein [Gammaproteobacteria bacterium]